MTRQFMFVALAVAMGIPAQAARGAEVVLVEHPIAILPFRERGPETKGMGGQAADLLFASLVVDPSLNLVDREDLDNTLGEQKLNLSGVVNPAEAIQIGQLTGAKIIVTGSVFQVQNSLYLVAKIIGTETSRVLGASAKGPVGDGLDALATGLGQEVIATIQKSAPRLVAQVAPKEDQLAALKQKLGDAARPTVRVQIEERHVGRAQFDPAAATEVELFCRETGFPVSDPRQGAPNQADILIEGQGFSEFATRRGDLISVKARLEVKAVDRKTGRVIAADRQTRVAVDLTEQVAGKSALQAAAADIAQRLLPKLVAPAKGGN